MAAGFVDFWRFALGWLSVRPRGPFRVQAGQVFHTGTQAGQVFHTGTQAGQVFD